MSSDFIFSNPSFLSGLARTLDLWAQLDSYNISATPADADALALRNDWKAVEQYILQAAEAFGQMKHEQEESTQLAPAAVNE